MKCAPNSCCVLKALALLCFSALFPPIAQANANARPPSGEPEPPKWEVLKEQMRRDSEGLRPEQRSGAHRSVNLGGRYLHMSAAVRDSEGRLRKQCFTSYEALDNALKGKAAVSQKEASSDEAVEQ